MSDRNPNADEHMFNEFFEDDDVREDFSREYVSLWPGWLGEGRLHLLDEVSEKDWSRFKSLVSSISRDFRLGIANCSTGTVEFPDEIECYLGEYRVSMGKDASQFSKFIIPELNCAITEEWDYTYIIWHKHDGAVDALKPYVLRSSLHHFSD